MKKILFLLCLLLGHIASALAGEYTLDASTLKSSTKGTATFSNGLSITNGGGAKPLARNLAQTISSSATAYSTPSRSHRVRL